MNPTTRHTSAGTPVKARKAKGQKEPTECQPSSTECGGTPPRRTVPGRNGGTLTPFPPGQSGNPHRGPDKFPRRNVVRAQYLSALTGQGGGWPVLDRQGRLKIGRGGRVVLVKAAPTRMLHANALAYKIIAARAERGLDLDIFLRMISVSESTL